MAIKIDTRYPSIDDLRTKAQSKIPKFAFEYLDGGCNEDVNLIRNTSELRDVQLKPNYLRKHGGSSLKTNLFGIEYDAPFGIAPIWTRFKVKLNSIAQNTPIYFAFRHYSNDQYILGLDNIRIESNDLTSNKENIKSKITIFPNPSPGTVNFNNVSEDEFIKIYNSKGQEIWNGILLEKMNLNFNPGNYFIKTLNEVIPFIVK